MKKLLFASAAAALLMGGAAATAGTVTTTTTITPAHRTIIRQYVVKEHLQPVQIRETVAVGTVLPDEVMLQPVPEAIYTEVPEVKTYQYVDWDGKVVFVEPSTRKVVEIVE